MLHHVETSQVIYNTNHWIGFLIVATLYLNGLTHCSPVLHFTETSYLICGLVSI